jgi:hypothetical protein
MLLLENGPKMENSRQPLPMTSNYVELSLGFKAPTIWQAQTEPKCHFFDWLALLGKAPIGGNLVKNNLSCNPMCPLCFSQPESVDHLLTECSFAEAVWDQIAHKLHVHQSLIPFHKGNVANWIEAVGRVGSKHQHQHDYGIILCFFVTALKRAQ